jgi:hypothetical protein
MAGVIAVLIIADVALVGAVVRRKRRTRAEGSRPVHPPISHVTVADEHEDR